MAEKDYYAILGISKNATKDEIKSAYRKLALKYHPDHYKAADAQEKFQEITDAYNVLYDDEKRKTYDQFGSAAFDQNANPSGNPFGGGFSGGFDGFGDIFSQMFGGAAGGRSQRTSSGPTRGNDSLMRVKISFMDAINGKKITIPVTYDKVCPTCNGTGARSSSDIVECPHCSGRGYVTKTRQTILGMMQTEEECPYCHGTGKIINNKCPDCNGTGYKHLKEDVKINIPAGINAGQQIRVSGKGGRGYNGGPSGDLYVEIIVAEHTTFKRDGNDIHLTIPLDFIDAALGTTISVPYVYGDIDVKIPAGTQPNAVLRIKDKGIKDMRNGRPGHEYIHIDVKVPTSLSKDQATILKKYKDCPQSKDNVFTKFRNSFKK